MLNNIRNFAKTKFAGLLVVLLIIPFVFWGMGGMFSGGNTNNIAKINNKNISTKDFMIFLNNSEMDLEEVKKNIDNNIIEDSLTKLISTTMLNMEVQDLNLVITDQVLTKGIKENKEFQDDKNIFSRTKYEKFLLSSNLTAPEFELRLRENELKRELFNYISGGLVPPIFSVKKNIKEQTKKVTIDFLNLSEIYRKKESFSNDEISSFIKENEESLKEKKISFKYSKITPNDLIGLEEYNNLFFEKIDEIENEISNGVNIENIAQKFNLKLKIKDNYLLNESNTYYKKIYEQGLINKIEILDENDFYILYEIKEIKKILPNKSNKVFISKIKDKLFNKLKYDLNNDLIQKITSKKFTQNDFKELAVKNSKEIKKTVIETINDDKKFSTDSLKLLYSLSINDFGLVTDRKKNIYLISIKDINYKNILNDSENFLLYEIEEKQKIVDFIYGSYDFFLNNKYKVKINEKTLERVKNYFR
tara:strand:- start:519 stop:1946 length:1428 start_codon:yes stop_codon:yes gene_type:complete